MFALTDTKPIFGKKIDAEVKLWFQKDTYPKYWVTGFGSQILGNWIWIPDIG